jgi:hypothetical protein
MASLSFSQRRLSLLANVFIKGKGVFNVFLALKVPFSRFSR